MKHRRTIISSLFLGVICNSLTAASKPPGPSNGMLLRVRKPDGTMERLLVPPGAEDRMSLQSALSELIADQNEDDLTIKIGSSLVQDNSQTLTKLGLKRGSLITLAKKNSPLLSEEEKESYFSSAKQKPSDRWEPYPELAKDYGSAVLKTKTRRSSQNGMSYGDLANLQSSMHIVEPQPEGPIQRVYMCADSAQRFQANCYKKARQEFECRVGLLLGTVQRERTDLKPKARTSLSSQTESSQYCDVVKVHALWEPPAQHATSKMYDANSLEDLKGTDPDFQRVLRVAGLLGLRPVGWIFSYNDDRHKQQDSLPVYAPDASTGSRLQIANMQSPELGRIDGSRFVTLSMDATSGATEAFQLSDVCVQMVSEDLWDVSDPAPSNKKKGSRFVTTKHAVLVDGKETKELDSVLCLINTAMLSHKGSYAGPATNSIKKSGGITNKVKKALLTSLDQNDDAKLFATLSDFNLLLTLEKMLPGTDMEQLCSLVRKWARGQKRGTELDDKLKLLLQSMLDH